MSTGSSGPDPPPANLVFREAALMHTYPALTSPRYTQTS